MPNFLSRFFMKSPYNASSGHLNSQRINGASEVLISGLGLLNSGAIIPAKLAQTLISGYCILRKDTQIIERLLHCLQFLLAGSQLGLAISTFLIDEPCENLDQKICRAVLLCKLLYDGTLLIGWVPSEVSFAQNNYAPIVVTGHPDLHTEVPEWHVGTANSV